MSADAAHTPVPRRVVLGGVLAVGVALVGIVAGVEALRHPAAIEPVPAPADEGDPRELIVCPERRPPPSEFVNSDELYQCPALFDGATVRFQGEVVGAVLERADGAWVQINDDVYAGDLGPLPAHRDFRGGNAGIGVHLPTALAARITHVGGPNARGDVLTVTGVFHRVDARSGEVAVIRAGDGTVSRTGEPITHAPLPDRRMVGVLVVLAAAGLLTGERLVAARRRR